MGALAALRLPDDAGAGPPRRVLVPRRERVAARRGQATKAQCDPGRKTPAGAWAFFALFFGSIAFSTGQSFYLAIDPDGLCPGASGDDDYGDDDDDSRRLTSAVTRTFLAAWSR